MKFYDEEEEEIINYVDNTGYKPYCFADIEKEEYFYNLCRNIYEEQNSNNKDEIITIKSFPCEEIDKYNGILHKNKKMLKIYGDTPLDIYNPYDKSKLTIMSYLKVDNQNFGKEYNIKFHHSYKFDNHFVMGMPYKFVWKNVDTLVEKVCEVCGHSFGVFEYYEYIKNDYKNDNNGIILGKIKCKKCKNVIFINKSIKFTNYIHSYNIERKLGLIHKYQIKYVPEMADLSINNELMNKIDQLFINESEEEKLLIKKWMPRIFAKIPTNIQLCGYDIEIFDPKYKKMTIEKIQRGIYPVSCIAIQDNRNNKYILATEVWKEMGDPLPIPKNVKKKIYKLKDERKMLIDIFLIMKKYNIIVDFNGKNFDIPYLYYRAKFLELSDEFIPFQVKYNKRFKNFDIKFNWNCIHFDLYQFFSKKSLKMYAFGGKYESNSLGDITRSLLPKQQTKVNEEIIHDEMELECLNSNCNMRYYSPDKGKHWYIDKNYNEEINIKKDNNNNNYLCLNQYILDNKSFICNEPLFLHKKTKIIPEFNGYELMYYCYIDTDITMKLLTYNNFIVINLLFLLMRLSNLGLQEFNESTITNWIKSLFNNEHRDRNWIIPEKDEIAKISYFETSSSTDKQFKGANVISPIQGLHSNVTCMDYASLYPSIIKVRNLSYETIDNCNHEECKKNIVPSTHHFVCKIHKGIISLIIGTIRDIRVLYFKSEMKNNYKLINQYKKNGNDKLIIDIQNRNKFFEIMTSTFKVFINGAFGAMTYPNFSYKQDGMGESVTAYGRSAIELLINYVTNTLKLPVIYGDTDSVFIKGINEKQIEQLIQWSIDVIQVPLGIDYDLRYMACSKRKKNYIGFYRQRKDSNGKRILYNDPLWKSPLIKGMQGKKKNTPKFIREKFIEILNHVDQYLFVTDNDEETNQIINNQIVYMKKQLLNLLYAIKNEQIPITSMSFIVGLSKDIEDFGTSSAKIKNKKLLKNARIGKMNFINHNLIKQNISTNLSLFEREIEAYKKFDISGFQLQHKTGLYLLQHGIMVGKGDRIEYIKTLNKYNGGALPTVILDKMDDKWGKIDKNSYYNTIKSVFSQLYDCFDIDVEPIFNKVLNQKKITTLDLMFR